MALLQRVWKQHLRPRVVVGYGVKVFLPSPPNYVTRSGERCLLLLLRICSAHLEILGFPIGDAYQYSDTFTRFKTIQRK